LAIARRGVTAAHGFAARAPGSEVERASAVEQTAGNDYCYSSYSVFRRFEVDKEATSGPGGTDEEVVLKVAKNLQGSYSRQTAGEPRKWRDVSPDEKKLWTRLARTAQKIIAEAK